MIRTERRLADGRAIVYYDADGSAGQRGAVDTRDLPAVHPRPQLRRDPLLDEWVTVAAHRQDRTFLPPADECPLCPSRPGRPTEIPEAAYQVVVLENRFPSLAGAHGRCEVVCFTDRHELTSAELGPERARLVLDAWADRTAELSALDGVAHVFPFENSGAEIGVTLAHPHGQVYGYPFVPPRVARVLDVARRHRAATGGDLFAEVVAAERGGPRVVTANEHWSAVVPAAARWPYEVQLWPHRRVPDTAALDDEQRDAFVAVHLDVLGRFAHRFDTPMPYVAAWDQAPVHDGREEWWLHLQLFSVRRAPGKLKYLAGSESGMGAFVTDTVPEDVAEQLRAVRVPR